LKDKGVFDVNAMSLFTLNPFISSKYIIVLLNSFLIYHYKFNFVNNSSAFQINDARQIPIIIPSKEQLTEFEAVFDEAYQIQKSRFDG
jgi:hypothetical protein